MPHPLAPVGGGAEARGPSDVTSARLRDDTITAAAGVLADIFPRQAGGALTPPPRRILVLKPCCLGDLILATATLRALRLAFPNAMIDMAAGASGIAARGNQRLTHRVDIGRVGLPGAPRRSLAAVALALRPFRYDTAITLDRSPLIGMIPLLAGIQRRIGLDSGGRGFPHTLRVPALPDAPRHEAEVYLDTLRAIAVQPEAPRLEFFPAPDDEAAAGAALPDPGGRPLAILHAAGGVNPGMTLLSKRWPPERFAALADRLIREHDAVAVLVGGPDDTGVSAQVVGAMRGAALDLTGRLSFGALAALIRRAAVYVGNDTGATHLAVAMDAPTVMVMGPTDPRRYGPYRPTAPATVAAACPPDARPEDYVALHLANKQDIGNAKAQRRKEEQKTLTTENVSVEQVYTAAQRVMEAGHAP
ncbi:MAG: glycosyltransferase family 9 protein [Anaerolineae bacterium]